MSSSSLLKTTFLSVVLAVMALVTALPAQANNASYQAVPINSAQASVPSLSLQQQGEIMLVRIMKANGITPNTVETFKIDDEDTLNAATDGKNIIFTKKLWTTLTSDDQRAFVLAHELAHIDLNHIPKTVGRKVGMNIFSRIAHGLFGGSPAINLATRAGLALADLRFSRSGEYQADERGVIFMTKAGYDSQGAIETLEVLHKASPSNTPEFLRSHPISENRMQRLGKAYHSQSEN